MSDAGEIQERKVGHLALFKGGHPSHGPTRTTLLEQVELIPDPLPELALAAADASVELLGRRLRAPLMLTGMTGGAAEAGEINQVLASLAGRMGLGFGVGSQRAMLEDPALVPTYDVRAAAGPDALVLANVGIAQLSGLGLDRAQWLVEAIGADALCVHLNVAQELVQPEGDRQFVGATDALRTLCAELDRPVVAKEVGSGFGRAAAERLRMQAIELGELAGGGISGCSAESHEACHDGGSTGVFVGASSSVTVDRLLLHDLSGRVVVGVSWGQGAMLGDVRRVTAYGLLGDEDATGIRSHAEAGVTVRDSIVVNSSGQGLYNEGPLNSSLSLSHALVWGHDAERHVNVEVGQGVVDANPKFLSAGTGDFRLRRRSPAVDAGDPASPCDQEPPPAEGACVVDLGYYGGTPQGWSGAP